MRDQLQSIHNFSKINGSYLDTSRGAGVWERVQDLHDCGAGDFVWDFEQLGVGSALLGRGSDGDYLRSERERKKLIC